MSFSHHSYLLLQLQNPAACEYSVIVTTDLAPTQVNFTGPKCLLNMTLPLDISIEKIDCKEDLSGMRRKRTSSSLTPIQAKAGRSLQSSLVQAATEDTPGSLVKDSQDFLMSRTTLSFKSHSQEPSMSSNYDFKDGLFLTYLYSC